MSAGRVEFFLSCSDLTAHNAFVGIFLKDSATQKWIELGRTEVSYNSNPKYAKQFVVDFIFEEEQQLRFDVYRSVNNNTAFISKNVLGSAAFKLSEVVHAKHQMLTRTLTKGRKVVKNRASKRYSRLNLRLEPLNTDFIDNTAYNFKATHLPKQSAFGKANPILEVHRLGSDGKFFKVFETVVIKKNLAPKWPEFTLTSSKLCNGDENRTIQLKIYHVDKSVKRKYIGKCQTSYNKLLNDQNKSYVVKDTKGKQVGTLILNSINVLSRQQNKVNDSQKKGNETQYKQAENAAIENNAQIEQKMQQDAIRKLQVQKSLRSRSKFLEYLESSELSLMIAVDFTGSNGKVNDPQSLHYIYKQYVPSPYQKALREICGIVAGYDSDQKFPVWGFGAKFPQIDHVSHEFALNPNSEEVDGVNGIEQAYLDAIQSNAFQLSGPCCYSPILTKAINDAIASHNKVMQSPNEKIQYYILLILTNGQCCDEDKQTTKNRLIYASNNNLPLSIIFVGIGNNDFTFLNELDGDFDPIKDDKGNVAQRDIVQFVAMKDFVNKPKNELSKYTLREIPIQFVSYVDNNGLKPRKNPNFGLKRAESKFYMEDEDESGFAHYKGDTMFQISQTDLDIESDEEEDIKEEAQPGSPSADPMANVPVPKGWEKSYTASGRPFFINHNTKTTTWVHPLKNQMNREQGKSQQTELQKKQAAAYNVQLMNSQFDHSNKKAQPTIVSQPIQHSNTYQPQQIQKSQTMYQPQVQRTNSYLPQVQYAQPQQIQKSQTMYQPQTQQQQPRVVYVQPQQPRQVQYGQPQQVQYGQPQPQQQRIVYVQQQQPQQGQYGQPQQVQYGQPQQVQYGQPQQVQYGQPQQQRIVYAQPQQQYGQPPQQQFRKKQW